MSSNIYKLLTWLSPSFPVSSYAYSHAFEQLIEKKIIKNGEDCFEYIVCLLENGSLKIDAVLINNLYKAIEEKKLAETPVEETTKPEVKKEIAKTIGKKNQ